MFLVWLNSKTKFYDPCSCTLTEITTNKNFQGVQKSSYVYSIDIHKFFFYGWLNLKLAYCYSNNRYKLLSKTFWQNRVQNELGSVRKYRKNIIFEFMIPFRKMNEINVIECNHDFFLLNSGENKKNGKIFQNAFKNLKQSGKFLRSSSKKSGKRVLKWLEQTWTILMNLTNSEIVSMMLAKF